MVLATLNPSDAHELETVKVIVKVIQLFNRGLLSNLKAETSLIQLKVLLIQIIQNEMLNRYKGVKNQFSSPTTQN
jgi:hypothetical protein